VSTNRASGIAKPAGFAICFRASQIMLTPIQVTPTATASKTTSSPTRKESIFDIVANILSSNAGRAMPQSNNTASTCDCLRAFMSPV
jgi:hypothetical protein